MGPRQVIKAGIREAFGDVSFPNHMGIHAAIAMDDWISDPNILVEITEEKDVKGKWWEIPESEFKYMSLASCYFDAKSTEFYLPAFMTAVINDTCFPKYRCLLAWLEPGVNDEECAQYDYFKKQFANITGKKKASCITVLEYIRDHIDPKDYSGEKDVNELLSNEFWNQSANN